MKIRVLFQFLAAGFLIGISSKYLLECYGWGYYINYKAWFYPILDFIPILIFGLVFLSNLIIVNLKKGASVNV